MSSTETTTTTTKSRKQVSKRAWLDAAGNEVDAEGDAVIGRYSLILNDKTLRNFDRDFSAIPSVLDRMTAIFGWHTKLGNVANSVLNDKDEPGDADDAASAISAWVEGAEGGKWSEDRVGGVGAKIDLDALANALVDVQPDLVDKLAKIRQKLDDDKAWRAAIRKDAKVSAAYAKRVGASTKPLGELLSDI